MYYKGQVIEAPLGWCKQVLSTHTVAAGGFLSDSLSGNDGMFPWVTILPSLHFCNR